MREYEYDVVLSFAGEDRQYAEELANLLDSDGYDVFYDKYEQAQLWGRNLYTHLSSVYKDKGRYCVMFLSEHYARKLWTSHELENAQARAFEENEEYILPVRIDDTEIPGILSTIGYLDLRSMSIAEIYENLALKLSGETPHVTPDSSPSIVPESDLGEYMLLVSANEQLNFIPLQEARRDASTISAKLLPETSEHTTFLRSLRDGYHNRLAFAYQEDAARGRIQEVVETTSGSQTVCETIFNIDSRHQDYDFLSETTVNNISPDQIAEMRAKRILLDEKLEDLNFGLGRNMLDYTALEVHIRGVSTSSHGPELQVISSQIPQLYQEYNHTPKRFIRFARLISILYLKLSNTVENILELDMELMSSTQLRVRFKGHRPRFASNVEPPILEFEGICPLSA